MATTAINSIHQQGNYLVLGLGVSGFSAAHYLLEHGYRVRAQDSRAQDERLAQLKALDENFECSISPLDQAQIGWADILVVSPGISVRQPLIEAARAAGKRVIGDVELFAEAVEVPVIAITGSNGKSTVTTMVGAMIAAGDHKVAIGGNLGRPALDLLDADNDIYVLELSSYQLETTESLKPAISTILNITEDHLDRYRDYQDYSEAKLRIYRNAEQILSNSDDPQTRHSSADITFSLHDAKADFALVDEQWLTVRGQRWVSVEALKISGQHNYANALAAMALADAVGVSKQAIVSALCDYTGIPHRSQWVANINGVDWINDSKATNPGAAKASIAGRGRPVILLAGGQSKQADMSVLRETLAENVKQVYLFGEDADSMQASWQGVCQITRVETLEQAVDSAGELAESGDIVLLAPACASFDQFDSFEKRGETFIALVREREHG